jgi:hypothetical protein
MGVRGSSRFHPFIPLAALVLSVVLASPVLAAVGGSVFKTRIQTSKSTGTCNSGDPCQELQYAGSSSPLPKTEATGNGEEINATVPLVGGTSGGIFVQNDSIVLGGTRVSTNTVGGSFSGPGPGGTTLNLALGMTTIRTPTGSEHGSTAQVAVSLPVHQFKNSRIAFKVGEQYTNTSGSSTSRLIFGVDGQLGGGGQAASAPVREPMQPPQLASARPASDPK